MDDATTMPAPITATSLALEAAEEILALPVVAPSTQAGRRNTMQMIIHRAIMRYSSGLVPPSTESE